MESRRVLCSTDSKRKKTSVAAANAIKVDDKCLDEKISTDHSDACVRIARLPLQFRILARSYFTVEADVVWRLLATSEISHRLEGEGIS